MLRRYSTETVRKLVGSSLVIFTSVLLTISLAIGREEENVSKILAEPVVYYLIAVVALLLLVWISWDFIDSRLWRVWRWFAFRSPKIGILKEDGIKPHMSSYSAADWYEFFKNSYSKTEYIRTSKISPRLAVIINPYGEGYPEEDTLSLRTFQRIDDYVYSGGIFLNSGGYPFYWALDLKSKDEIPIAEQGETFEGEIKGTRIEMVSKLNLNEGSLVSGTLLSTRFHLSTTLEDAEEVVLYQNEDDVAFSGRLVQPHESVTISQFRALRKPLPRCIPVLRARSKRFGEIFPLAAFPYGGGYYLMGGMHLALKGDKGDQSRVAFFLSCKSMSNIINRIRDGTIKSHDLLVEN